MKVLYKNSKIYIGESSVHGWGVFTNDSILKGDIIEECNFIEVDIFSKKTDRYLFQKDDISFIPAGFCSCLNSSQSSNVRYEIGDNIITFIASCDIAPGSELFMYYGSFSNHQLK